jgi:hypothetical protein
MRRRPSPRRRDERTAVAHGARHRIDERLARRAMRIEARPSS